MTSGDDNRVGKKPSSGLKDLRLRLQAWETSMGDSLRPRPAHEPLWPPGGDRQTFSLQVGGRDLALEVATAQSPLDLASLQHPPQVTLASLWAHIKEPTGLDQVGSALQLVQNAILTRSIPQLFDLGRWGAQAAHFKGQKWRKDFERWLVQYALPHNLARTFATLHDDVSILFMAAPKVSVLSDGVYTTFVVSGTWRGTNEGLLPASLRTAISKLSCHSLWLCHGPEVSQIAVQIPIATLPEGLHAVVIINARELAASRALKDVG